jgi:hypothetical protein
MEATRVRFRSIVEWVLAAAFLMLALGVGSMVVREFRTVNAVMPVIAREAPVPLPAAAVPPGTVSVPMLPLSDGNEIRVGDLTSQVAARLTRDDEVGRQSVERAPNGERVTRFYVHGGVRFVLVFEPSEQGAEPRVAAIYLQ